MLKPSKTKFLAYLCSIFAYIYIAYSPTRWIASSKTSQQSSPPRPAPRARQRCDKGRRLCPGNCAERRSSTSCGVWSRTRLKRGKGYPRDPDSHETHDFQVPDVIYLCAEHIRFLLMIYKWKVSSIKCCNWWFLSNYQMKSIDVRTCGEDGEGQ